jgi:hypothetical protein
VIDEADFFVLNDPARFDAAIGLQRCICVTATATNFTFQSLEKEIFDCLEFKMFNYWPSTLPPPSRLFVEKQLPKMEK